MSEQPPATGQRSPDGRYFWDGQAWQPVSATPAPKSGGGWGRTIVVGIVCLIVGGICGGAIASSSQTASNAPTASSSSTPTATATAKPAPTPRQPVARMGQGSTVTPIHLDKGNYKVSWSAQGGQDNFIVHIHLGSQDQGLVNEIPPNPSSGETFFASPQADDYTLEVKASTLTWSITFTPA